MRFVILAIAFLFLSPVAFANETESDLQWMIEEVRDTRTTANWSRLEILTKAKSSLLKDAKRERIQIIKAEDNLGNDLKPEKFNKYHKDFYPMANKDNIIILPTIELASPPREATHIKNIEGTIELYIPDLDSEAQVIFSNFSEKLEKIHSFKPETLIFIPPESSPLQKYKISLQASYRFSDAARADRRHRIEVRIVDKNNKVLGVAFIDKKGNEIRRRGGSWREDRTEIHYYYDKDPAEIADLVVYLKTEKAIKLIPLEYKNIPLP